MFARVLKSAIKDRTAWAVTAVTAPIIATAAFLWPAQTAVITAIFCIGGAALISRSSRH